MNICKECKHVSGPKEYTNWVWYCAAPSNGTDPQTGATRRVCASKKNPRGECLDFEPRDPLEDRRPPPTPATLPPPQPRYRSPLWVRVLRWLVQEHMTTAIDDEMHAMVVANTLSAHSQTNGRARGDVFEVEFWYPRDSKVKAVEVSLIDVRASADIRIAFDFGRNGWSISRRFDLVVDDPEHIWTEVAFVDADRRKTAP